MALLQFSICFYNCACTALESFSDCSDGGQAVTRLDLTVGDFAFQILDDLAVLSQLEYLPTIVLLQFKLYLIVCWMCNIYTGIVP